MEIVKLYGNCTEYQNTFKMHVMRATLFGNMPQYTEKKQAVKEKHTHKNTYNDVKTKKIKITSTILRRKM